MAGRPSSLTTHSALRLAPDSLPAAGTPVRRTLFMASRIPGLAKAALDGVVNCLLDPVAYGQRFTPASATSHITSQAGSPHSARCAGNELRTGEKRGVTRTRLHSARAPLSSDPCSP